MAETPTITHVFPNGEMREYAGSPMKLVAIKEPGKSRDVTHTLVGKTMSEVENDRPR